MRIAKAVLLLQLVALVASADILPNPRSGLVRPGDVVQPKFCVTDHNGQPVIGAQVDLVSEVITGSGAHYHDNGFSGRPRIVLNPTTVYTGGGGCVTARGLVPFYAGIYLIWANCTQCINDAMVTYTAQTGPYSSLSPSQGVTLVPDVGHHNANKALTTFEQFAIAGIGARYFQLTVQSFSVYRGSLPLGGINDDLDGYWNPANPDKHEWGRSWDVLKPSSITQQQVLLGLITSTPNMWGGSCKVNMTIDSSIAPLLWHCDCESL